MAVTEPSLVGEARRSASRMAEAAGLDEETVGRVALVVTELAGNLVKHTPEGGELVARLLRGVGPVPTLEILALDRGAGMDDVGRCMQDGYSTAGSPGTGLGAVARLSDLFQVHSAPGLGTAILSRVGAPTEPAARELGVVNEPKAGQTECGDSWTLFQERGRTLLLVADGLGHGAGAALASREAVRVLRESGARPPTEILERMHAALRSTRGAAVAVADVPAEEGELRFVGVGNIAGSVHAAEGSRSVVSQNGIVGHEMRRVQEFTYPWTPGSTLILHSDGLSTRWDLSRYPGLASRHPALIAGVLYRDFNRGNDDSTVAVLR